MDGDEQPAWLTGAVLAMASVTLVVVSVWWEAAYGRARADLRADAGAVVHAQVGRAIWWGLVLAGFPIVGVFILKFRRRNLIGWLFCGFYASHLVLAAEAAGSWRAGNPEFMRAAERRVPRSPARPYHRGLMHCWPSRTNSHSDGNHSAIHRRPALPTGRLPTREWVWVPILMAISVLLLFAPGLAPPSISPLISGLAGGIVASALGSCASLLWRYRRSDGIERLQLRWAAFGVAVALCVAGVGVIVVRGSYPIAGDHCGAAVSPCDWVRHHPLSPVWHRCGDPPRTGSPVSRAVCVGAVCSDCRSPRRHARSCRSPRRGDVSRSCHGRSDMRVAGTASSGKMGGPRRVRTHGGRAGGAFDLLDHDGPV